MAETETSTRQRLLDLWEKCPECRPEGISAIANEAMTGFLENWLEPMGLTLRTWRQDGQSYVNFGGQPQSYKGTNRTLALISAVEAVMEEKQDA